jgi:HlyD family secretion protein
MRPQNTRVAEETETTLWKVHPAEDASERADRPMDTVRQIKPPSAIRKYWYIPAAVAVLLLFGGVKAYLGRASYFARHEDLKISIVQPGDFAVNVRANGKLKSKDVYMLASKVSGSVGQVLVKAGDTVMPDTAIVNLVNPQLTVDLIQAKAKLQQVSAEREVSMKSLESTLLDQEVQLLNAKMSYQTAQRDYDAKTQLSKFGEGLISKLEYQQAGSTLETQKQIWEYSQKRVSQMRERLAAEQVARNVELQQLQEEILNVQSQIDQLVVRAAMKGTLQSLAVSPGQKLNIGDSVGVVADTESLIAQLQVPELQIQQVTSGLPVTIDTRRSKIEGRVIRVAPSVQGGMVDVDVALDRGTALPAEARADLSVEGLIRIVELKNTLYMDRPDFAKANTVQNLYRLTPDESRASRIPVKLGEASVNQIQILSGAKPGDKIITSDASAFATHDTIIIK